jgi:hypothetical protein
MSSRHTGARLVSAGSVSERSERTIRRRVWPAPIASRSKAMGVGLFALAGLLSTAAYRAPDPVPSGSPPPPVRVEVQAADITVGPEYWQGTTEPYRLSFTVRNAGVPAIATTTAVTLPPGLRRTGAEPGPCEDGGLTFECRLDKGASVTVTVVVAVAAGAWREPPRGSVRTTARAIDSGNTDTREDPFTVMFPPGPPTPGINLAATGPTLPALAAGRPEKANLTVRLRNTGPVQAVGAVELLTPPGVQVATMPAVCVERSRISLSDERCGLGRVASGQDLVLSFALTITPQARAEAPLSGTVQALLTPSGQDTITVQATYQITVADGATPSASPSTAADAGLPFGDAQQAPRGAANQHRVGAVSPEPSPKLSVLPVTVAIFGLFGVLTAMVILSLHGERAHSSRPPDVRSK